MSVTIKDIAKIAGVSHPTVSRALNHDPGVNEETRRKIQQIAKQLNYVPNLAARRLADRKSNCIGLIWPSFDSLFFFNLCKEIQLEAAERGLNVLISLADPVDAMRTFNQQFVDRIIFWSIPDWVPPAAFLKEKERFKGDMLLMGGGRIADAHCLKIDRRNGIYEAVRHLAELGHSRIAFIGQTTEKLVGFTQGIVEFKLEFLRDYLVPVNDSHFFDEPMVEELLNGEVRPTAIVMDSQIVFFQLLKLLRRFKLRVPEDLSLIVYDDVPELQVFEVPLTTIGPPIKELAAKAIDMLMTKAGQDDEGRYLEDEVKSELVIRESAGKRSPQM